MHRSVYLMHQTQQVISVISLNGKWQNQQCPSCHSKESEIFRRLTLSLAHHHAAYQQTDPLLQIPAQLIIYLSSLLNRGTERMQFNFNSIKKQITCCNIINIIHLTHQSCRTIHTDAQFTVMGKVETLFKRHRQNTFILRHI